MGCCLSKAQMSPLSSRQRFGRRVDGDTLEMNAKERDQLVSSWVIRHVSIIPVSGNQLLRPVIHGIPSE